MSTIEEELLERAELQEAVHDRDREIAELRARLAT